MIATLRGLAILGGIALALLVVLLVLVLGAPKHEVVDRSLWPGFDPEKVTAISIIHGDLSSSLKRVGDEWQIEEPAGRANRATIDALFTALRGGRWHRMAAADVARLDEENHRPGVSIGDVSFFIGDPVSGSGQTWIVRGMPGHRDVALLVDSWISRALSPDPLSLRVRTPLECTGARQFTATWSERSVRIEQGRLVEPRGLWLDDAFLARLAATCSRVEIVDVGGTRVSSQRFRIAADTDTLEEVGTCERGRVLVATSSGDGCVDAAALGALRDIVAELAARPEQAIDRTPLPIDPAQLTLADGTVLDVAKLRLGDVDADRDAVRELVQALQQRGESVIPHPTKKPRATIKARDKDGAEVVLEIIDDAIGRAGEPSLIRIDPRALAIITRPSAALRDATRWREDATTLSSLTLDGVTYRRGAVLGEWTREPAGTVDAALVDALVETLTTVRAPIAEPPRDIRHRLSLTFTPPAGTPTKHVIELALPTGDGCAARIDGQPVRLALAPCTAAIALAQHRK